MAVGIVLVICAGLLVLLELLLEPGQLIGEAPPPEPALACQGSGAVTSVAVRRPRRLDAWLGP